MSDMIDYRVCSQILDVDDVISLPSNCCVFGAALEEYGKLTKVWYGVPVEKKERGSCNHRGCGCYRDWINTHCIFNMRYFLECKDWRPEEEDAEQQQETW